MLYLDKIIRNKVCIRNMKSYWFDIYNMSMIDVDKSSNWCHLNFISVQGNIFWNQGN